MATVATQTFFEIDLLPPHDPVGPGPTPEGYRWVITDMQANSQGAPPALLSGFLVSVLDSGVVIWSVQPPLSQAGWYYQWAGRKVLDAGDYLAVEAFEAGWSFSAMGYSLTLP